MMRLGGATGLGFRRIDSGLDRRLACWFGTSNLLSEGRVGGESKSQCGKRN
jgi:hypothetical protein